jgi:lysozyme family protein
MIGQICDLRLAFLRSLPTWPTFGKGWWARVENVRKEASSLARHPSQE